MSPWHAYHTKYKRRAAPPPPPLLPPVHLRTTRAHTHASTIVVTTSNLSNPTHSVGPGAAHTMNDSHMRVPTPSEQFQYPVQDIVSASDRFLVRVGLGPRPHQPSLTVVLRPRAKLCRSKWLTPYTTGLLVERTIRVERLRSAAGARTLLQEHVSARGNARCAIAVAGRAIVGRLLVGWHHPRRWLG